MRQAVKTERWNRFAGKADRFAAALILVLALAFMLALTFCAFTQTADLNTNDPSCAPSTSFTGTVTTSRLPGSRSFSASGSS